MVALEGALYTSTGSRVAPPCFYTIPERENGSRDDVVFIIIAILIETFETKNLNRIYKYIS